MKKFYSKVLMLAMMVAAVGFIACSGDNVDVDNGDDNNRQNDGGRQNDEGRRNDKDETLYDGWENPLPNGKRLVRTINMQGDVNNYTCDKLGRIIKIEKKNKEGIIKRISNITYKRDKIIRENIYYKEKGTVSDTITYFLSNGLIVKMYDSTGYPEESEKYLRSFNYSNDGYVVEQTNHGLFNKKGEKIESDWPVKWMFLREEDGDVVFEVGDNSIRISWGIDAADFDKKRKPYSYMDVKSFSYMGRKIRVGREFVDGKENGYVVMDWTYQEDIGWGVLYHFTHWNYLDYNGFISNVLVDEEEITGYFGKGSRYLQSEVMIQEKLNVAPNRDRTLYYTWSVDNGLPTHLVVTRQYLSSKTKEDIENLTFEWE